MSDLIHAPALSSIPGLVHGFTRRTLDLGTRGSAQDWARLAAALGTPPGMGVALAAQVHGRTVLHPRSPGPAGEGDALVTDARGLLLAIRTADCIPVLLLGADSQQIAAAHAGWRGLAAGILPATVQAMHAPPALAVVGPCISVDHYEVGEEVIQGICAAGVPEAVFTHRDRGPRPHADLRAAAVWQLRQAGVDQIEVLPRCTFADPDLHSHRRDGDRSGRLAAVIGWLP